MQNIIKLLSISLGALLIFGATSQAALKSPFPSSVAEIDIPNTHLLPTKSGRILRGMAPLKDSDFEQLRDYGVEEIILFKNESPKRLEVTKEIEKFVTEYGYDRSQLSPIPFKYKEFEFKTACLQTIEALEKIEAAIFEDKTLFFHCTVGEDRTGYLSALMRYMSEDKSLEQIFQSEMCERGYGAGNPNKARNAWKHVVEPIRRDLTPMFLKMAYKIKKGQLSWKKISKRTCSYDPGTRFKKYFDADKYKCKPQKITKK